ncbi:MAG TPA: response regulator transcription factor [Anaeromyxobacteraceae bacterium]|nr:response regulator transcription factor [Anaeromyxobacteraceae bacterium]
MAPRPLRVLLVAGDPLARGGLAAILDGRGEIGALGRSSFEDAAGAARDGWDAIAWDLGAGGGSGADGLHEVAAAVPVVALFSAEDDAAEALRAGARGAVARDAEPEVIAAALSAAARGLGVLDAELAAGWLRPPAPPPSDGETLTPREREVLQLLAEGLANKAIAARLGIAERTAKFHVNAILGKVGAASRSEAIVKAARQGLVVL